MGVLTVRSLKKMPQRQQSPYMSLRERKKKRQSSTIYGAAAIALLFIISFNFLSTGTEAARLRLTEINVEPLNFRAMEPVQSWHGEQKRIVYLTFNEGPTEHTAAILDLLAQEEVPARFYAFGFNILNQPGAVGILNRILGEGHGLGIQTTALHDYLLYRQVGSDPEFMDSLEPLRELVHESTGYWPTVLRPPYGTWDHNVDSGDWHLGTASSVLDQIRTEFYASGEPANPIVRLHQRQLTVEALPAIIQFFRGQGYRFGIYEPADHFPVSAPEGEEAR